MLLLFKLFCAVVPHTDINSCNTTLGCYCNLVPEETSEVVGAQEGRISQQLHVHSRVQSLTNPKILSPAEATGPASRRHYSIDMDRILHCLQPQALVMMADGAAHQARSTEGECFTPILNIIVPQMKESFPAGPSGCRCCPQVPPPL